MKPHLRLIAVLLALCATAVFAEDPKTCSASAKDCEKQIREMLSGRRYLGLQIVDLKPGLVVKSVVEDSPAARAGFREGDRLVAVNGHNVTAARVEEFKQILYGVRDTGTVWVIVQRHGSLRKVDARLEVYSKEQIDKIIAQHLAQAHSQPSAAQAQAQPTTAPQQP